MIDRTRKLLLCLLCISFAMNSVCFAANNIEKPNPSVLINDTFISDLKTYLKTDIVRLSVKDQNHKNNKITDAEIKAMDDKWRAEVKSEDRSIISSVLLNPLSAYLTRLQAHSLGLFTEIFIMDNKGLNVGQSNITSDLWQGDEAKWQKTFQLGSKAIFIDEAEWNEQFGIWVCQVNISVNDEIGFAIGAATFEVNLTELARRAATQ